tara:strand:+ start:151 stop:351 length:201 start_codon:yes stop_codon:yes gene_type:complete
MSQVNEKVLSEMSESMKKIIMLIEDHKKKIVDIIKEESNISIAAGLKTRELPRNNSINNWCESLRN